METVSALVNQTDHEPLNLWVGDRIALSLPRADRAARCQETTESKGDLVIGRTRIPLMSVQYGEVEHLPPARPGVIYIVSQLVVRACPERTDLLFPTDLVRDAAGSIIGCRALARTA